MNKKNQDFTIWNVMEKRGKTILEFSQIKFPRWLKNYGFCMIQTESENGTKDHVLVRINKSDNTISVIDGPDEFRNWMSKHFLNTSTKQFTIGNKYCTTLNNNSVLPFAKDKVIELIMKQGKTFCDTMINNNKPFIKLFDKEILIDNKKEVFMNFENGVIKISENCIELLDTKKLKNKYRYVSSLIHKNKQIENYSGKIVIDNNIGTSKFEQFCILATSKKINDNLTSKPLFDKDYVYSEHDMKTLMTAIGYLCSNYKEGGKSKFVLFQDRYMDGSSRQGRNGKSVIAKSILKFIKGVLIPADKIDLKDNFAFNNVNYGDKIIFFDEILPNKKFIETLFNEVNGFLNVRKLYKGTFTLSGQDLPKFIGCSNFSVWKHNEMSQSERIHCVEFSDFFNKVAYFNGSPNEYFDNKWIFDNMDDCEWNKFFNFIFRCVQMFLSEGFYKHPSPMYKNNVSQIVQHFNSVDSSIIQWIDNYIKTERITKQHMIKDKAPFRDVLFDEMRSSVGSQVVAKSSLDITSFTQLIYDMCEMLGYEFNPSQKKHGNTSNLRKLQKRDIHTGKNKYVIHIVHPTELK